MKKSLVVPRLCLYHASLSSISSFLLKKNHLPALEQRIALLLLKYLPLLPLLACLLSSRSTFHQFFCHDSTKETPNDTEIEAKVISAASDGVQAFKKMKSLTREIIHQTGYDKPNAVL